MGRDHRWDPCVAHRSPDVDGFIAEYFALPDRRLVLIAGAGFDPRSTAVATRLAATGAPVRALSSRRTDPFPPRRWSSAPAQTRVRFSRRSQIATSSPSISSAPTAPSPVGAT
jgi:hypothetical protein